MMDSKGNIKFHSLAMNCCFVSHVTIGSDPFMCFQQERLGASCFAQGTLQEMFGSEFIDEHDSCRMIGKTITVFCGGYTPRLLRQIRRCRSVQYAKYVRLHLPKHLAQPFGFGYINPKPSRNTTSRITARPRPTTWCGVPTTKSRQSTTAMSFQLSQFKLLSVIGDDTVTPTLNQPALPVMTVQTGELELGSGSLGTV